MKLSKETVRAGVLALSKRGGSRMSVKVALFNSELSEKYKGKQHVECCQKCHVRFLDNELVMVVEGSANVSVVHKRCFWK